MGKDSIRRNIMNTHTQPRNTKGQWKASKPLKTPTVPTPQPDTVNPAEAVTAPSRGIVAGSLERQRLATTGRYLQAVRLQIETQLGEWLLAARDVDSKLAFDRFLDSPHTAPTPNDLHLMREWLSEHITEPLRERGEGKRAVKLYTFLWDHLTTTETGLTDPDAIHVYDAMRGLDYDYAYVIFTYHKEKP
jgi:hypothetical protein